MPRPRHKPFWRWTPLPWLVLIALMLATGTMHDLDAEGPYAAMIVVSVLFAIGFAIGLIVAARRRGPNFTAEGRLARLEGLDLVAVPAAGHPITVFDVSRHQISIEAALAHGSRTPQALLVPDAGNWWNLRADIAVYLLAENGFHLVGRLGDRAQVSWQARLDELRADGRYAVVPAEVTGAQRPYAVDVRLEGLHAGKPEVSA
jgi:hypothetical protein